jgi:hypothetical protein
MTVHDKTWEMAGSLRQTLNVGSDEDCHVFAYLQILGGRKAPPPRVIVWDSGQTALNRQEPHRNLSVSFRFSAVLSSSASSASSGPGAREAHSVLRAIS